MPHREKRVTETGKTCWTVLADEGIKPKKFFGFQKIANFMQTFA
jgi:hypothetical protein